MLGNISQCIFDTRSLVIYSTVFFILNSGDINWCVLNPFQANGPSIYHLKRLIDSDISSTSSDT